MNTTAKSPRIIRLGARGSLLSRMQSAEVARLLEAAAPEVRVEIVAILTSGDRIQDRPLHELGGKGLFTKELELALLRKEVDFAVHSFKDVPVTMPLVDGSELVIAATPVRADARDVFACVTGRSLADLPAGKRVGTGSLRRQAQILEQRPDLRVEPIRGNIDTRLRKLRAGEYDAVILALAGLQRAELFDPSCMTVLDPDILLPAAGQGALALECRRDDEELRMLLGRLNDPASALCVRVERNVVAELHGDCHSPIGVYATVESAKLRVRAVVGGRDGRPPVIRAEVLGEPGGEEEVKVEIIARLNALGAASLLRE